MSTFNARSGSSLATVRALLQSLAAAMTLAALLMPARSVPADVAPPAPSDEHLEALLTQHAVRYAIHTASAQVQDCLGSEAERGR